LRGSKLHVFPLLALVVLQADVRRPPETAPFPRYEIALPAAPSDVERFAGDELRAALERRLHARVTPASPARRDAPGGCRIVIGTSDDTPEIARAIAARWIAPPAQAQGYTLRVGPDPARRGARLAVIAGNDARGALYGTMDLVHFDLAALANGAEPLVRADAPRIQTRGLWSWAGRIYNYERYLDNMARWKLNTLVLWHAYAPANGRALADYAKRRGVDLVWGYNLAYENPVCPSDTLERRRWQEYVVRTYERDYAPIGATTVYFQAFTETGDKQRFCRFGDQCPNGCKGKSGGQLLVEWMNPMIEALLARHPNVHVVCGVHASALHTDYRDVAGLDPRASLMWEDAGDFPFAYDPEKVHTTTFAQTLDLTHQLAELRGPAAEAAFVFKGMSASYGGLDAMLEPDPVLERLAAEREPAWRKSERGWRAHLDSELEAARIVAAHAPGRTTLVGLAEDGLWEERAWFPVVAFAESAWNPARTAGDLTRRLDDCADVARLP